VVGTTALVTGVSLVTTTGLEVVTPTGGEVASEVSPIGCAMVCVSKALESGCSGSEFGRLAILMRCRITVTFRAGRRMISGCSMAETSLTSTQRMFSVWKRKEGAFDGVLCGIGRGKRRLEPQPRRAAWSGDGRLESNFRSERARDYDDGE